MHMVLRFIPSTSDVAGLRRAVLHCLSVSTGAICGRNIMHHPLTMNAEGANKHLTHPGLSLQLSQEVYYSTDSY